MDVFNVFFFHDLFVVMYSTKASQLFDLNVLKINLGCVTLKAVSHYLAANIFSFSGHSQYCSQRVHVASGSLWPNLVANKCFI